MTLALHIKKKKITLSLKDGDKEVDAMSWEDQNDLSEKFFGRLENFLQKNNVARDDIDDISFTSDEPEGYTTTRIAQTIAQTFSFAVHNQ